jgi:uncharacterized protein YciI
MPSSMIVGMAENLASFLVMYHYVPDMETRRTPHRAAHLAWLKEHAAAGRLILAGAIQDPVDSAVLIFRGADILDIRRLLLDDPYAAGNLIDGLTVRPIGLAIGG